MADAPARVANVSEPALQLQSSAPDVPRLFVQSA